MRYDLRKSAADMITSGVNQVLNLLENFWEITYSEQSWVDQGLEWKDIEVDRSNYSLRLPFLTEVQYILERGTGRMKDLANVGRAILILANTRQLSNFPS